MANLLLIDDDENLRRIIRYNLERKGHRVVDCPDGESGIVLFSAEEFDIVISDMTMPGISGMDVLERVKAMKADVDVIIITAYATVESAVEAMKKGAFDYVTKPFDREELAMIVDRALKLKALEQENVILRSQLDERHRFSHILGASSVMKDVLRLAGKVASSDASVLILGPSGTGKEMLAQGIHHNSERQRRPFVVVNCAAVPEGLIESELFGHKKGAFTGAVSDKVGKFEAANGGTLFLDEIGELRSDLQAKLLRVLQSREVERVGENRLRTVDVRILSATNVDIESAVKDGKFRQDLYYRLGVITLVLPPLVERREDIPVLADHFLKRYAKGRLLRLSTDALDLLLRHHWPGNVRELENVMERAAILCEGDEISPADLPESLRGRPAASFGGLNFDVPEDGVDVEALERELIVHALALHGGNQTRAARFLHMTRPTLIYRLEKYGLKGEVSDTG